MSPKQRLMVMVPVLLVAGWLALFGDKTPSDEPAEAVARRPAAAQDAQDAAPVVAEGEPAIPADGEVIRVLPRTAVKASLDSPEQKDLFGIPQQQQVAQAIVEAPPPQAEEPPPAVMPFTYIGREFDAWRRVYFLEKDGQTFVVAKGDRFEGFALEAASEKELTLLDLSTKTKHLIQIDGE